MLEALKILAEQGIFLNVSILGDGKYRPRLEVRARELDLGKQVVFHGKVPYHNVLTFLDRGDLFLMPSKTEGLPKAMIEAMARGLPCIGSTSGGIPELLPPEDTVPPGDAMALANKINEVAESPERLTNMSARNLSEAKKYRSDVLRVRRLEFYRYVRAASGKWQNSEKY
jgi:glycosyltransferase involved in cell wall biosynthesis